MTNANLEMDKLYFRSTHSCLRLTPYMEFSDGTKGSVMLLNFNNSDSSLYLFNSPERADGYEKCTSNTLTEKEADSLIAYQKECSENNHGDYEISPGMYDKFGVVLLTEEYISAHIADFFCRILNAQQPPNKRLYNWQTDRSHVLLHNATYNYTIIDLEAEIDRFLSAESLWQRTITMQALNLHHADEFFNQILSTDRKRFRAEYIGWLQRETIKFKLCFAEQLSKKCPPPDNWLRMLEAAFRMKKDLMTEFHYSNYAVQEIIGLYALSKHLYTEKPANTELVYAPVSQNERIQIFTEYNEQYSLEILAQLQAEDDPYRTEEPTIQEAEEKAKRLMGAQIGRRPVGLSAEQKDLYSKYEKGFCMKYGVSCSNNSSNIVSSTEESMPKEKNYNEVREYIEENKLKDKDFKQYCDKHSLNDLCTKLSPTFGWVVNENSLRKNLNRHNTSPRIKKDK